MITLLRFAIKQNSVFNTSATCKSSGTKFLNWLRIKERFKNIFCKRKKNRHKNTFPQESVYKAGGREELKR